MGHFPAHFHVNFQGGYTQTFGWNFGILLSFGFSRVLHGKNDEVVDEETTKPAINMYPIQKFRCSSFRRCVFWRCFVFCLENFGPFPGIFGHFGGLKRSFWENSHKANDPKVTLEEFALEVHMMSSYTMGEWCLWSICKWWLGLLSFSNQLVFHMIEKQGLGQNAQSFGSTPHPLTVTTRIITFLVADPGSL